MNLERVYKYCNYIAVVAASFLAGTWLSGMTEWWLPLVALAIPTTMFLVVVLGALLWSFYITKDE